MWPVECDVVFELTPCVSARSYTNLSWLGTVSPWPSIVLLELNRATASADVPQMPCDQECEGSAHRSEPTKLDDRLAASGTVERGTASVTCQQAGASVAAEVGQR